MLLRPAANI